MLLFVVVSTLAGGVSWPSYKLPQGVRRVNASRSKHRRSLCSARRRQAGLVQGWMDAAQRAGGGDCQGSVTRPSVAPRGVVVQVGAQQSIGPSPTCVCAGESWFSVFCWLRCVGVVTVSISTIATCVTGCYGARVQHAACKGIPGGSRGVGKAVVGGGSVGKVP